MKIPPKEAKRLLYGFSLSAKIRAWLERCRGHTTMLMHELTKSNGELLLWLFRHTRPLTLAPFYAAWPDAKLVWAVYVF